MKALLLQMQPNRLVPRIPAIAAIGGFLFGHDTSVISGALLHVKTETEGPARGERGRNARHRQGVAG